MLSYRRSSFYSSPFEYDIIALINKPTGLSIMFTTIIDNVSTRNIFDYPLKRDIIKSDLSDLLSIFFSVSTLKSPQYSTPLKIRKRIFNKSNLASFKDPEAVVQNCSVKKVLLEISQNSQEITCAKVSFLIKLQG